MAAYRLYHLGRTGAVLGVTEFTAGDDSEALEVAALEPFELRERDRVVETQPKPPMTT
jgi:hypothetical protein